jgi:predicted carbohydrate-binding protein with CBM5 and CBM33 domain
VPLVMLALILPAMVVVIASLRAQDASAHGTVVNPMTRNYGCLQRWTTNGASFQDPTMAQKDPMCWQAWQADASAMWNWNGLYQDNVGGRTSSYTGETGLTPQDVIPNHRRAVPDGQLCSGGHAASGRYNALDKPGNWTATPMPNNFKMTLHDGARHGSDYNLVYITKQGFDVATQPLRWSDLELVKTGPRVMPGVGSPSGQTDNGVDVGIDVNAGSRTGNHIVFTIWQASHSDQSYYLCSDVRFGGGSGNPPPTPAPAPTTTTTWTPTPTPTTAPPVTQPPVTRPPVTQPPVTTPPAGPKACTATYQPAGNWGGSTIGAVTVKAGGSAISRWTVTGTLPAGQRVSQLWGATITPTASGFTATSGVWTSAVAANATTGFWYIGTGVTGPSTLSCSAT